MTLTNKVLVGLLIFIFVGTMLFVFYKEHQIAQTQTDIQNSLIAQKTLVDGIARSQSQYVSSADLQKFAEQNALNLKAIQDDLDALGGKIDAINSFSITTTAQNTTQIPSSSTIPNSNITTPPTVNCNGQNIPCPNTDSYGYQKNIQNLQLNEEFGTQLVPFGSVAFDASQAKPWSLSLPQRQYNINTVIAHKSDGQILTYNQMSIVSGVDGKEYNVNITKSQTVETYNNPSWSFLSPKLFLGVSGDVNLSNNPVKSEITPSVSIGLISYGKTTTNPDLSILQLGVGYQGISNTVGAEISPIQVNIGHLMNSTSLITNTYLGPTVGVNTMGQVNVGAGIRVGL